MSTISWQAAVWEEKQLNQVVQVQWTSFENCLLKSSYKPQGIIVVMDFLSSEFILVMAVARTQDKAWDS